MNDLIEGQFIPLSKVAEKVGLHLFGKKWNGDEFNNHSSVLEDDAKERLEEVRKTIHHFLIEDRIPARVIDDEGSLWPLSDQEKLHFAFQINLSNGTVGGIHGPDDFSDCYLDAEKFYKLLQEARPPHPGGRPTKFKWKLIVHQAWLYQYFKSPETAEEIVEYVSNWYIKNYGLTLGAKEVRQCVSRIRKDIERGEEAL